MGAKSTETLTRAEAENLLARLQGELWKEFRFTDEELEDELERLNDSIFQRDGYYQGLSNYLIRE